MVLGEQQLQSQKGGCGAKLPTANIKKDRSVNLTRERKKRRQSDKAQRENEVKRERGDKSNKASYR